MRVPSPPARTTHCMRERVWVYHRGASIRLDLASRLERAKAALRIAARSDDRRGIRLVVGARKLDVDHAQDRVVELRDEVARHRRLLMRAAHARVVREEQIAPTRELGGAPHRALG